jgi:hypothetical protein
MSFSKRRRRVAAIAAVVCIVAAALVYWFEPHTLFFDRQSADGMPAGGVAIASGKFRSLEHETRGEAILVELPDGRRVLRLENLATSNGPKLRVYLSSVPAQDDWFVYDDGPFLDLGDLAGNVGSSNYELPASTDLSQYQSAVVWCQRFSVGFGVAPLERHR